MKKLLLVLSLTVTGLSGCYVEPYGSHDDGYRRDRDHHEDSGQRRDRKDHEGDRGGERERDRYH